ncbi:MAG TPA: peptidylprolyl isomerase, partial [Nannocystaceae bacterium]|nr:peptidylprolyl isomerase [Nannocystaceae bacterium]
PSSDAATTPAIAATTETAPSDDALPPSTAVPSDPASAPLPPGRTFSRGERAPVGLTESEIAAYNAAQGDPQVGPFELADAWQGDPSLAESRKGLLVAIVRTSLGAFECVLFEDEVPRTVANFVGLARGTRPVLDPKDGAWKTMRFYDGVEFHRVVAGFVVQTGDRTGTGSGDAGYVIADEPGRGRQHASVGTLAMANRGKNTGSSQFYVSLAAAPHLDGLFTVFGECEADVPLAIGRVKVDAATSRPKKAVTVKTIEIVRKPMPGRAPDVGPPLPR